MIPREADRIDRVRFSFDAPSLPPSAIAMRARVREFLAKDLAAGGFVPRSNGWMTHDEGFTRRCGDAGFIGLTLPREYGGHGRTAVERYVVYEEMLAAGAPLGMHWIPDRQSGPQILRHGSEEARVAILPRIAAGTCGVGIGMSEPDVGSDLASVRTRATRCDGGWRVQGTKLWTSHAHRAQYVIVLARTSPASANRHAGLTQLIVDTSAKGFAARPVLDIAGNRDFNEVQLDDVFVPDGFVLGTEGEGWQLVIGELAYERSGPDRFLSTFPLLVALVRRCAASPSADARRQVGRVFAHLATLRRMSLGVAAALDAGRQPNVEAAMVKDLGTALEREIPEIARLLHPVATARDAADPYAADLALAMLTAPSYTLRGGTREILRGIVARDLGLR